MKQANITNNMYVNQYDGETRITGIFISPTGKVDIYSVPISTPAGQLQISKDPILGKTRAINDIMQKQGSLGGSTSGEVQIATKTASIAIKNDYAYLSPTGMGIEMSRNVLEGILSGEGFYDSISATYKALVGTNGAIKRSAVTDQNYIFKKLFELDGRLKIADAKTEAGHAITQKNIRTPAYDKSCLYMIFESIYKLDDDNIEGIRAVYTMNSEVSVSDATDANEVSFTQTQLCDIRNIQNFIISGWGVDEVGALVPARPSMIAKTGINAFKATLKTEASNIVVATTTKLIEVKVDEPNEVVLLNSVTQEYETVAYVPADKDICTVYIPKTVLQAYVDGTGVVKVDGSGYAIAVYNATATKWHLATAGKVKENTILIAPGTVGSAVLGATVAAEATPTSAEKKAFMSARMYNTGTWNFEKSAMELI